MAAGTREEMADRTIAGRGASATDKGREAWRGAVGGAKKKHHMLFACFGFLPGHGTFFLFFFLCLFVCFFPSHV